MSTYYKEEDQKKEENKKVAISYYQEEHDFAEEYSDLFKDGAKEEAE